MLKVFQARSAATPTPPPAAAPTVVTGIGELPPQTPAEYSALIARRTELNAQLQWLQGQRSSIVGHIRGRIASEADRVGLDAQLQAIDKQILQVDANIAQTSQLIAQAPASALQGVRTVPPPYQNQQRRDNMTAGVFLTALSIVFIVFPLTVAFIRRMGRGSARAGLPPRFEETPARLERLEQALDTVAIEVERISESQRFMTRLMTETQLGSAVAGVRASAKAAAREAGVATPAPPSAKALGPGEAPFEPVRVREAEQASIAVPSGNAR